MPEPPAGSRPTRPPKSSGSNRGRPLNAVKGYGPVAQFARKLRKLLADSGRPRRVDLAHGRSNPTTMSKVDGGRELPTWDNVADYLRGCGLDAAAIADWKDDYDSSAHRAARFRPDLSSVTDRSALAAAVRELLAVEGVDERELLSRRDDAEREGVEGVAAGVPVSQPVPAAGELLAEPCDDRILLWTVYLGGGTALDVRHWQQKLLRFPPTPESPSGGAVPSGPEASLVAAPPLPAAAPSLPAAAPSLPAGAPPGPAKTPDGRTWPRSVLAGAGAILILATFGIVYTVAGGRGKRDLDGTTPRPTSTGPGTPSPVAPAAPTGATGEAAARALNDLADQVARLPAAPGGTYAHLHRSLRSVDTTDAAAPGKITEEWLTWSPAASGRRVIQVALNGVITAPSPEPLPPGPPRAPPDRRPPTSCCSNRSSPGAARSGWARRGCCSASPTSARRTR
ncbi:hypothetical protein [Dactylosporangium cerinum]